METISIKEYFEKLITIVEDRLQELINERDKQYAVQFKNNESSVRYALTAADKLTAAAFISSEKAIAKAEEAQKEYNARSNEFRGQLDDQAKTFIPRPEFTSSLESIEDKLEVLSKLLSELRLETTKFLSTSTYDLRNGEIQRQLSDLKDYRTGKDGRSVGVKELWGYIVGVTGVVVAITTLIATHIL